MRTEEIRGLSVDELQERIRELKEEQFRLRFQRSTMQLENPKVLNHIRRDIARIKTILRERELAQESGLAGNG
jgi:large subunit ribosomal protein L29